MLHLAGVLRHDVHQLLHRPAVAELPHLLEGHHCKEVQTASSGPGAQQALPGSHPLLQEAPSLRELSPCSELLLSILWDDSCAPPALPAHLLDGNPRGTELLRGLGFSALFSALALALASGALELGGVCPGRIPRPSGSFSGPDLVLPWS